MFVLTTASLDLTDLQCNIIETESASFTVHLKAYYYKLILVLLCNEKEAIYSTLERNGS
jgi:hypothetical protein